MIGQPRSFRRVVELFRNPATAEKSEILADRWAGLDPALRLPGQGLGQKATGCGATIGIQPRCDFSCTGCYLGHEANHIPSLPTEAILRQLDELRRWLGPKSNVQITDGEVTLRPVEELTGILRYARSIGIIPMVMTHGDNFRRQPGLLERLMTEGHLTEVSIHVDITQRGRDGYRAPRTETELMPLRDEFAAMIRTARKRTGRKLRAATTLTITSDNLPQVPEVVEWTIRNRDAFGLISFQPLAQVGRTRKGMEGVTPEELWTAIGRATAPYGADFHDAEPMHFGHPDCTRFVPLMAVERGGETRLLPLIRNEADDVRLMEEFFGGGIAGAAFRDDRPLEMIGRGAGMILRHPRWWFGRVRRWADGRARRELGQSLAAIGRDALLGRTRVDGLTLTSHHFMSPAETATEVGQARLAACVFKLPVDGEMVPMCAVNAGGIREQFYAGIAPRAGEH